MFCCLKWALCSPLLVFSVMVLLYLTGYLPVLGINLIFCVRDLSRQLCLLVSLFLFFLSFILMFDYWVVIRVNVAARICFAIKYTISKPLIYCEVINLVSYSVSFSVLGEFSSVAYRRLLGKHNSNKYKQIEVSTHHLIVRSN